MIYRNRMSGNNRRGARPMSRAVAGIDVLLTKMERLMLLKKRIRRPTIMEPLP